MGSYVPTTAAEREEMLAAIGVDSLEGLYKAVPQEMLLRSGGLNIPEGLSELEVREAVTAMAEKNKVFKTVLRGAGAYRHFIPSVVRSVTLLPVGSDGPDGNGLSQPAPVPARWD
mgnify:CR=1 FL=1